MRTTRRSFLGGALALSATAALASVRPDTAEAAEQGRTLVVAASNSLDKAQASFVCDGVADEEEINAALAALPAGPNASGTIVLLEGTYLLSNSIVINRSFARLVGQGWGTFLRLADNANASMILVGSESGAQHIEIRDLRLHGNAENQSGGHGIVLYGSGHRLSRVNVQKTREDGIRVESADGANQFEIILDDVSVMQPGRDGLYLGDSVFNSEFIRVVVHGSGRDGGAPGRHGIYDRGTQNKFLLCHPYYNPGCGFFKDAGKEAVIDGGEFENNGSYGIRLFSVRECQVAGALVYSNGDVGVSLSSCIGCTVTDTVSRSAGAAGIYLSGGMYNLIRGNHVTRTTTHGIRVGDNARLNRIDGNMVYDLNGGSASIWVNNSFDNDVANNVVEISLKETGSSNGNRFLDNRVSAGQVATIGAASESRGNRVA